MNHHHYHSPIINPIKETLTPWLNIYTKQRSSNSMLIFHLYWLQSMHTTQITVRNLGCMWQSPLYKALEGNEK